MTPRQIEQFMSTLAAEIGVPARAYLTGAAAAALWGRVRPSFDVDLGLELKRKSGTSWEVIERAVERTTRLTGIAVSVAEDIDRWGMITLLDYKRTSRRYRLFGQLELRLLHPANWSIGKLTRSLESDLRDVVEVFRRQSVSSTKVVSTWGRALRASPASTAQFQFRRNVERFLRQRGRRVWGESFDVQAAVGAFWRAARIARAEVRST
ncbi:MAG TPA: hypothetical protein VH853_18425 [Polyangia bacterium]|jgi:hypothetical protein|nr:hypothetical protein [Polyangia bacterium]